MRAIVMLTRCVEKGRVSVLLAGNLCQKGRRMVLYILGAIEVLRNAVGGGGCQLSRKRALRRCTV